MFIHLYLFTACAMILQLVNYGQERVYRSLTVTVDGEVEFVIEDSLQRRSGFNPKLSRRYDEINDSYGVYSIDSENPDVQPPEPVKEFETLEPLDGPYKLDLFGTKLSKFKLSIVLVRSVKESMSIVVEIV